jgi:hypothetical protein
LPLFGFFSERDRKFIAVKLLPTSAKDENLMFDEHATVRTKNAVHLDL